MSTARAIITTRGASEAVIVYATWEAPKDALHLLALEVKPKRMHLTRFLATRGFGCSIVIFDTAGFTEQDLEAIAVWRGTTAGAAASVVFIVEDVMRARLIQVGLHRFANVIKRPLDVARLPALVRHLKGSVAMGDGEPPAFEHYARAPEHAEALRASDGILDSIFGGLSDTGRIDAADIANRSNLIVESLGESGVSGWVDAVRAHHNRTYQHCLLVTGTLLAFGHHLGLAAADMQRLAVGGLLHDIGKADIPLAILDKPAALTPEEFEVMRGHPTAGVKRLSRVKGSTEELVAFTRDHHEYLDGSGYPHGLMAESISDPVRLLTIADIFAALIERRSYKPEMPAAKAIEIMQTMKGKLDPDIFKSVLPVMQKVTP
jgi:putative nucleotidyltransferase with HDIG domain